MSSAALRSQWQQFLTEQGYQFEGRHCQLPTKAATSDKPLLIPLTHFTAYSLNGPDGKTFLQGQTSCNITKLSEKASLLGVNTNPKGSVINFFRLMKLADEELLLRFPYELAEQAAANFNKYIVFSKAEFTPADEQWVGIGLQGINAETLIAESFGECPKEDHQQLIVDNTIVVKQLGELPRYEIWTSSEHAESLWGTLMKASSLADTDDWLLADMAAGIAIIDNRIQEEFIPQMLNLHVISAVDFHKGCYTGQEIITRLQYRGKLNKCLYRVEATSAHAVSTGTPVWSSERQQAGEVISVIDKGDQQFEMQIVIHIKTADTTLRLNDENGPELHILPLPYTVDPEWRPEEPALI